MADKLNKLSDGTPRDASEMGRNSRMSLYVGVAVGAIVIGLVLYWLGAI